MMGLSPLEAILPIAFVAVVWVLLVGYPFLALGKIWQYSRKQTEVLEDIKKLLEQPR